jgi:hypothetical protein
MGMNGDEMIKRWHIMSEEVISGMTEWRRQHPKATFREIEAEVDKRLAALRANWASSNVESETNDPASILSHYRDLILIRSQHAALRVGDLSVLNSGNDALYAILRVSQQEAVLVVVNLSGSPVSDYALSVAQSRLAEGSYTAYPILGEGDFAPLTTTAGSGFSQYIPLPEIPPYATIIIQLNDP